MTMIKVDCDASTFHDFAMILDHYLMDQVRDLGTDIVFKELVTNSLKEQIHRGRGSGTRKVFNNDTKYPDKIRGDFLKND